MNINSFLGGFAEAIRTVNEMKLEQAANVISGGANAAKSLFDNYKTEKSLFEKNQEEKQKAKKEEKKLGKEIEQIDKSIAEKQNNYNKLLDEEKTRLDEIIKLKKQLQTLELQGKKKTQEYTVTQENIVSLSGENEKSEKKREGVLIEEKRLKEQKQDKITDKEKATAKKEQYEEKAKNNLNKLNFIDENYKLISTNGKGLRQNLSNVRQAVQNYTGAKIAANGGTINRASQFLKGIKGNPYMLIAQGAISAVEFAIGKITEYAKVNAENQMRMMEATTAVSLNKMSSSLAAWQNSMDGAYDSLINMASSTQSVITATNANELANVKLRNTWTNWIPIWGTINKLTETELELKQKIQEMEIANAQKKLAKTQEYAKKTDEYLKKQDNSIHKYQATTGMSSVQTEKFEKRMLTEALTYAKYNKNIEDVINFHTNYIGQSGRAVNLSKGDYEKSMAIGMLVGDDNFTQFSSEMNLFNQSVSSSAELMYEMYNDANKMGLSQQKLTKSVLSNMKMAEKYSFKNGVKGFIELAKWAQNVRFNLDNLSSMLDKAQDSGLEGAITQSAKLQVLGGRFAMYSDPIAMQYEVWNDPEAYAKRIKGMFGGFGRTDNKTGETTFAGVELNLIKEASKNLGMNYSDALNIIREDRKKEIVKRQLGSNTLIKGDDLDGVINKSFRDKDGVWKVNLIGGGTKAVSEINQGDIENILSDNDNEALTQYAKETLSVEKQIEGTTKNIYSILGGEAYDKYKSMAAETNKETMEAFMKNRENIAETIKNVREESLATLVEQLKGLDTILTDYAEDIRIIKENAKKAKEEYRRMIDEQNATYTIVTTTTNTGTYITPIRTKDGIGSGEGNPMVISADKITPINDGSVSGAITDPNDHAIFAKVGGPFDTLFNGVFKQVNALYHGVLGKNNIVPKEPLGKNSEFAASNLIESRNNNIANNNRNLTNTPFKIEINGKLTLDSNGQSVDIINELKNNPLMIQALSNMIANNISAKKYGGRALLDASFRN